MKSPLNKPNAKKQLTFALPIMNLETKLDELSIGSNIKMRQLTTKEKQYLQEQTGPFEATRPPLPRHCLEITAEDVDPAVKKAYPVMCALRILKSNLVGINSFLCLEYSGGLVIRLPSGLEADASLFRINKGIYVLEKNEKTEFLQLFNRISSVDDKKLILAFIRFNEIYRSQWLEATLLDLTIVLESLYLTGGAEKKFRLCCYMSSAFSSDSERDTKEIWNYVYKMYDLRSKIVHGSGRLPRKISIGKGECRTQLSARDFVEKIEEYTRQSIRKFMERGKKVQEVQSDIKEEIIEKIGKNIN